MNDILLFDVDKAVAVLTINDEPYTQEGMAAFMKKRKPIFNQ